MSRPFLLGAQAVEPASLTIWEAVRNYFVTRGMPLDYALFSTYEALNRALLDGAIDAAWNAPLAQAQVLIQSGGACRALAMRDTDREVTTVMLVPADSAIRSLDDLRGRRLALGTADSSELSLIPRFQLAEDGLDVARASTIVEFETQGDAGEIRHVPLRAILAALAEGRIDATTLFEPQYRAFVERGQIAPGAYREIWRSRPYSHCGFAARPGLADDTAARFVEILTSMDYAAPEVTEMMDLEHLRAWVPADSNGWQDLVAGVKQSGLAGASWGVTYVVGQSLSGSSPN